MPISTVIKVRGFHLDGYQHVNNARYLEFLEEARWDMTDKSGVLKAMQEQNLGFVVVNININYRAPAVLWDVLEVMTRIKDLNRHKGVMEQIIYNQNTKQIVVEATVTYVILDLKTEKITQLNDELFVGFQALQN